MSKIKLKKLWQEYEKGVNYNTSLDLYRQVEKNENFYMGKQWQGLNAPDLAKPVINVLRRVVSYFIAMIVSDDVTASFTAYRREDERAASNLQREVEKILESSDIKTLARDALRDAAVDGDGAIYFYYDLEDGGKIKSQLLSATDLHYGNPHSSDVQSQPYLIVSQRLPLERVIAEAKSGGISGEEIASIRPDRDENRFDAGVKEDNLVTVITKLYRKQDKIYAIRATRNLILKDTWCTDLTLYPIAVMPWDKVKNSCRGNSALGAMIPNQIAINQLFAMAIHHVKTMAFPKIIYDASKIKAWSNKVGQAIGTQGNPNDAIASGFRAPDMSEQVLILIERLIQNTLEFMGASDSALGNVKPDNTSAIIATQKASAMPLELQRLAFYRFTEDYVRILADMIATYYGIRKTEDGYFDFSRIREGEMELKVDVGAATYWSELMQMQTLDNMFTRGIISDAVTYLESVPDRYLRGKAQLIEKLSAKAD